MRLTSSSVSKDIAIQNLRAISAVKRFDISILHWFAGVNELQYDVPALRLLSQQPADEFRAVVHLNAKYFAVEVIQHIEYAKAPPAQ